MEYELSIIMAIFLGQVLYMELFGSASVVSCTELSPALDSFLQSLAVIKNIQQISSINSQYYKLD